MKGLYYAANTYSTSVLSGLLLMLAYAFNLFPYPLSREILLLLMGSTFLGFLLMDRVWDDSVWQNYHLARARFGFYVNSLWGLAIATYILFFAKLA